ncbi:MAG TPA: hypothetical protein DIT28_18130 [Oxalobacteraceae bacterium]|nr:hypothetical protein [Oxalobacteraceae bacterium]
MPNSDLSVQRKLVAALLDGRRYPHVAKTVRLIETHISWVLLAGRYAYKIKKAVDLDFLNFTQLDARRFFCTEEIRLNRRLAPKIYLNVVAIGGSPERPQFGAQPAIEYAVRMRRFASSRLMDNLLEHDRILPQHIDRLAAVVAAFHQHSPVAATESPFGTAAAIHGPMLQTFEQLCVMTGVAQPDTVDALQVAFEAEYRTCQDTFSERRAHGFVRECHGDLHLGNIALIGDEPVPFDCIEFDPALRWIDIINDVAFTLMDLLHRARPQLAYRFLNAYLEASGDYAGVALLRFYCAGRALVRAKINAIQATQLALSRQPSEAARSACGEFLALAAKCVARREPALIITHGLPGSGKTTFAQIALERFQAIRIRSDVERKRLFGLAALDDSRGAMYGDDATQRTYAHLLQTARMLLTAGVPVIVDAAFLRQAQRAPFQQLAQDMDAPFAIAAMNVDRQILGTRITQRLAEATDASEADLDVLTSLQATQETLAPHELRYTVRFVNSGRDAADAGNWLVLEKVISAETADPRQ